MLEAIAQSCPLPSRGFQQDPRIQGVGRFVNEAQPAGHACQTGFLTAADVGPRVKH